MKLYEIKNINFAKFDFNEKSVKLYSGILS